jgi:hypothetical protein
VGRWEHSAPVSHLHIYLIGISLISRIKTEIRQPESAAYASVFWVFCIGDYFVGPLPFSVFSLPLVIVIFALRLRSARL